MRLVSSELGRDPLGGEVFIFVNRSRTTIKLLHWERGGLVLYHKRLESGRFSLPRVHSSGKGCSILWRDLVMMVEGIPWKNHPPEKIQYCSKNRVNKDFRACSSH